MLNKSLIKVRKEFYLNLIIIIIPFLNFLVGINIDLYAPSLPAIADYYNTSIVIAKNTITTTVLGFAIGSIAFGTLMDIYGRRRIILLSFVIYIITSFLTLKCHSIEQLIILRFIQGLMTSAFSVGSRALVVDNFTGHRLTIALIYTSVSYGLGPIVGPFIGGFLQYHFGWKANFLAYALFAIIILVIFLLYINESLYQRQRFSFKDILLNYFTILRHKYFMASILIASGVQLEQLIYPTIGPFLVEGKLHQSAIVYGNTALFISIGYLCGALINRVLIKRFSLLSLLNLGFILLISGLLLQICFACFASLSLVTIVLPFMIIVLATGFLFPNLLSYCLRIFPNNRGKAIAFLTCILMLSTSIGIFIISQVNVYRLVYLVLIFGTVIGIQSVLFYTILKPQMKKKL